MCTWRARGGRWQTSQEVASMQDLRRAALEVQQVLVPLLFSIPEQRRLSATWRCTPKQRASLQYNSNEMDGEMESIEACRQWFGAAAGLVWSWPGLVRSGSKKGRSRTIQAKMPSRECLIALGIFPSFFKSENCVLFCKTPTQNGENTYCN